MFLEIRARLIIGEVATLLWSGLMDGAPFTHFLIGKKNTRTILSGLKGVFMLYIAFSHLTVADTKVPGHAINIVSHDEQAGTGETVTAIGWTKIAEFLVSAQAVCSVF